MSFNTASRLLITGTPLQNNVKELLALMHFLMPDTFHLANDFDLNDVDQESKIKDLHEKLETLMLRRLKKDVVKEMPTKSESILRVELSKMQTDYYKSRLIVVAQYFDRCDLQHYLQTSFRETSVPSARVELSKSAL